MKQTNIFYWILTALLVPALGIGSVIELAGNSKSAEVLTSLGYPSYISPFLAAAKVLALIAIFIPRLDRVKEWAYAGLVFDVTGATYSLLAVGRPIADVIIPVVTLAIIFGSYYFYNKRQRQMNLHMAGHSL
ncbi:DoxX-like family protein [Pedobacter yulinensis]|uniref:DoxX-like family protein n=2 Tax=Pedobacter yulinensis TaxID=2126353 RepID=A0A2T3HP18_9SPHI|nr:DoxX-like family protein [Pedobacter yulinensis]